MSFENDYIAGHIQELMDDLENDALGVDDTVPQIGMIPLWALPAIYRTLMRWNLASVMELDVPMELFDVRREHPLMVDRLLRATLRADLPEACSVPGFQRGVIDSFGGLNGTPSFEVLAVMTAALARGEFDNIGFYTSVPIWCWWWRPNLIPSDLRVRDRRFAEIIHYGVKHRTRHVIRPYPSEVSRDELRWKKLFGRLATHLDRGLVHYSTDAWVNTALLKYGIAAQACMLATLRYYHTTTGESETVEGRNVRRLCQQAERLTA